MAAREPGGAITVLALILPDVVLACIGLRLPTAGDPATPALARYEERRIVARFGGVALLGQILVAASGWPGQLPTLTQVPPGPSQLKPSPQAATVFPLLITATSP